jgi:predicted transcriptional regulator
MARVKAAQRRRMEGSLDACRRSRRIVSGAPLARAGLFLYTRRMEVTLSAELQAKLARIAEERGKNPQDLAREAIERLVDYDDWFLREVDKGLSQIERGQTLTHEDVGARLNKHLTGKPSRR